MKHVVSLSLGSSRRDKIVTENLLGEMFEISRVGVDGDEKRFVGKLAALDGTVDAIGFGGMDRYVYADAKRYEFAAARRLLSGATKTPILDGSGLKNTLEREAVEWLAYEKIVDFKNSKTLMVCGVDRFGMSDALAAQGGTTYFGDLLFALDVPYMIRSREAHRRIARLMLPLITQMPLSMLYPMGEKQNTITPKPQFTRWYEWADIIAGDFLYIRRYMPTAESGALKNKVILTNTTTTEDEAELRHRGARLLITTTPNFDGRSFGTNVMEALCVAANDGNELTPDGYRETLLKLGWKPTVRRL